jgi:hypothetical protein
VDDLDPVQRRIIASDPDPTYAGVNVNDRVRGGRADAELDRLDREAEAAASAVREHLATAVRAWRGAVPPSQPLTPITREWLDDHARLKSERLRAEEALQEYVTSRR